MGDPSRTIFQVALLCLGLIAQTVCAADGDLLSIHIIASRAQMDSGIVTVEIREDLHSPTTRDLRFSNFDGYKSFFEPYVANAAGVSDISDKISYTFERSGKVAYGYTVRPAAGHPGTGFCNGDIGILDLYWTFPSNLHLWDVDEVAATFEVPEDMRVYAPWEPRPGSDRMYKVIDNVTQSGRWWPPSHYQLSLAAWGGFSEVDSLKFGDHTFYMLGYKTDTESIFSLMRFSYSYLMKAFENNLEFPPPANIAVLLPDNYEYRSAGEGYGGFYNPNIGGEELEPVERYSGYVTRNCYYNHATNLDWPSVNGAHVIAHALMTNHTLDWWMVEGIAVYYQFELLRRAGILSSESMNKEFCEHLKFYQSEIVGQSKDAPLQYIGVSYHLEESWLEAWLAYKKGALVFFAVDEIIKSSTNGARNLADFWIEYYGNYKEASEDTGKQDDVRYRLATQVLTRMTGQDFGVFFDRYVVGSDPLPLEIVGDSIVVHFESPVSTLPGDFDGDGTVDFEDFVMFARAFGQTSTEFDLTGDNLVRFEDFVVFAQHFGQSSG